MPDLDKEPKMRWKRKNYNLDTLPPFNTAEGRRTNAEMETCRDLKKPVEQLLCDVHEETHRTGTTSIDNIATAQKRIASLMTRVAKSNSFYSKLNIILIVITIAIACVSYYTSYTAIKLSKEYLILDEIKKLSEYYDKLPDKSDIAQSVNKTSKLLSDILRHIDQSNTKLDSLVKNSYVTKSDNVISKKQ